jgi:hypothetical protein
MTKQTRGAMDKAQTDLLPGITPMIFFFSFHGILNTKILEKKKKKAE